MFLDMFIHYLYLNIANYISWTNICRIDILYDQTRDTHMV